VENEVSVVEYVAISVGLLIPISKRLGTGHAAKVQNKAFGSGYHLGRGDALRPRGGASRLIPIGPFSVHSALASGSLAEAPAPDVVAAIIRVTGGNFRLITRLLTQMERMFKINQLKHRFPAVAETARENLVIGQV
jgi:hypothetical protein